MGCVINSFVCASKMDSFQVLLLGYVCSVVVEYRCVLECDDGGDAKRETKRDLNLITVSILSIFCLVASQK